MRHWLYIKQPKCEIGYSINNQNAKLVIYEITEMQAEWKIDYL